MKSAAVRLERRYRQLLRCYPMRWQRHRADEMIGVLLDQAEADGHTRVKIGVAADLIGHGLEARFDALLAWLPASLRQRIATVALLAAAGLSLVMLAGEVIGAHYRQPDEDGVMHGPYFHSGPVLTIGVGLYLACLTALLLVVLGRGGPARVLVLVNLVFAGWLMWGIDLGVYARPRSLVLVLFGLLGLLSALATIRATRRTARRLVGYGTGFVAAVLLAMLLTKPVLGWSVGTMATSGNVALASLATALPVVGGLAVLVAALVARRHPGWLAAIAIAALPVVLFCTAVSQSVNPLRADTRALIPLYYTLVVVAVALVHRRVRHRRAAH